MINVEMACDCVSLLVVKVCSAAAPLTGVPFTAICKRFVAGSVIPGPGAAEPL